MTNTLQQDALKPCPFCGGEARVSNADEIVYCRCGAQMWAKDTLQEAITAWNTRPTDALKAENQRLREALKTARDYVRDADAGELIYRNGLRVDRDMTRDDLARIDAALTEQPQ